MSSSFISVEAVQPSSVLFCSAHSRPLPVYMRWRQRSTVYVHKMRFAPNMPQYCLSNQTVFYLDIVSDMWWRFFIWFFSGVFLPFFLTIHAYIHTHIKFVHLKDKCLIIILEVWMIWIHLSFYLTDNIHGVQCGVCWWGGDVWGHWILKLQPKIINC